MAQATSGAVNTQELINIAQNAREVLAKADTIFPFTVFPDTVIIDRVKITVKRRIFFKTAQVTSIQIEDVLNSEVNTGPFFGSLKIWTRFFADEPLTVNYLKNEDAKALKRILQGFIIARQKEVDCSNVDHEALVRLLYELGKEAPH